MKEIKQQVQDFLIKNPEPAISKLFNLLFRDSFKEKNIHEEYFKKGEVNDLVKKLNKRD